MTRTKQCLVYTLLLTLVFSFSEFRSHAQCDTAQIFNAGNTNAVCVDTANNVITISTNSYPDHAWGNWPSNSPVTPQEFIYHVCQYPVKGNVPTSIYDHPSGINGCTDYSLIGVGLNGVFYAGWGARWFVNPNTQQENLNWNVEATAMFNMDFNNAHSNNDGEYHYHGTPTVYFQDSLQIDGSTHSPLIGYAADGFPMYYKYVYSNPNDAQSSIIDVVSGYTLKQGNRPGDGITEPDGLYDGLYVEDYEFTNLTGPLDDCNGRYGVTPEYPMGTYYYVITDNWPYAPRCFYGTVIDNSFRIGPACPESTAEIDCSSSTVSIEIFEGLELNVYPNPTNNYISIEGVNSNEIDAISIYNVQGKIMIQTSFETNQKFDVSNWPNGSYFMQIRVGESEITRKIIKQ